MGTTVVYASEGTDGWVVSKSTTSYQKARQGGTLTADTTSADRYVGQSWWYINADWHCNETLMSFDVSGITGTIETAAVAVKVYTGGDYSDEQEFTLNVREYDYGGSVTTADWVAGASLNNYPLLGTLASSSFAENAYNSISLSLGGTICPDTINLLLCASSQEAGVSIGYNVGANRSGYLKFYGPDEAGTTADPKLTIVDGTNVSDCTISSPSAGGYAASVSLTATATDPAAHDVRYHWDYSTNGVDWSACPNSPSAYVTSGTAGTIAFDITGEAVGTVFDLRVRAYNATAYSYNYEYVQIAYTTQTGVALYRTAGADLVSDAVSGLVLSRPASGVSSLTFLVDNFDAGEADITDTDELVLVMPTETTGVSLYWRGFVRQKSVSDVMTVVAEDISYRFSRLVVTKRLGQTAVGALVQSIVEDPTGNDPTGILCTCAEVDDPANPGSYISVDEFDGGGRSVQDHLNDLAEMTGCQWYVYHDQTNWQFVWYDPTANLSVLNVKDNIDYGAEDASNARCINSPTVTMDNRQYINRVYYWVNLRGAGANSDDNDAQYTETTTAWASILGGYTASVLTNLNGKYKTATISQEGTTKSAGSYSVQFYSDDFEYWTATGGPGRFAMVLTLDASDYDWTGGDKLYPAFDCYFESDSASLDGLSGVIQWGNMYLVSGATAPTCMQDLLVPGVGVPATVPNRLCRRGPSPVEYMGQDTWYPVVADSSAEATSARMMALGAAPWGYNAGGAYETYDFDPTDVRYVVFEVQIPLVTDSSETSVYIDNFHFAESYNPAITVSGELGPVWSLKKVETAAVTADTEAPIETTLSTRNLSYQAAESVATGYLAAYNKTKVSCEDVQLFGTRNLDLDGDITLTLASRGITATALPITKIEYRFLDQGHVTSISLGDHALEAQSALERLVRRLQDITAEVRA